MASDYPGAVDDLTSGVGATDDPLSDGHQPHHTAVSDAVEAVQTELGVNPAGSEATVVARLDAADTAVSGKAATSHNHAAADVTSGTLGTARLGSGTANSGSWLRGDQAWSKLPAEIGVACSDETTTITAGTAKATFRMPYAMTVTEVRATLTTVSSSGLVTVDVNEGGSTILSTKLTVDASEKTSTTAATAAVISDSALADDAEITVDVDGAGTGAKGLKVWLLGARA